ncbi:MAG: CPBP family intramembrane metalloprotease [Fidelibacterota bacterium]|nr:MAG: CPBP family intramembrane metalloprotease [Candidatus Neomarinimicrobiota bacterium]
MMSSLDKKPWQSHPVTQILAVVIIYVPPYAFAIWSHLSQRTTTLKELFLYPLLIGGSSVLLILLVYRFICGERIASLNLKAGKWYTDILVGFLLAIVFLGLLVLQQVAQSRWLPSTTGPTPEEIITLFSGIVDSPLLLAIWLGPVVWLGVAAFEELTRVFMLNRLWAVWPQPVACWLTIMVSAALFGLLHIYQGPVSAFAIALQGFLYALYYKRFGRVWPMIIGHALYDSLQVIQVVIAFHGV